MCRNMATNACARCYSILHRDDRNDTVTMGIDMCISCRGILLVADGTRLSCFFHGTSAVSSVNHVYLDWVDWIGGQRSDSATATRKPCTPNMDGCTYVHTYTHSPIPSPQTTILPIATTDVQYVRTCYIRAQHTQYCTSIPNTHSTQYIQYLCHNIMLALVLTKRSWNGTRILYNGMNAKQWLLCSDSKTAQRLSKNEDWMSRSWCTKPF